MSGKARTFPVNLQAAVGAVPPAKPDLTKSLLRKRKRTDDPLDEMVVEQKQKKAKVSLEDAFAALSVLGSMLPLPIVILYTYFR